MPYVATDPLHDPTNPDGEPDLDAWGFDNYWDAQDWMTWHQAMAQKYGLRVANETFVAYWHEQGIGAAPISDRSFNETFRSYARQNGFLQDLYPGISVIAQPLGWGTDILAGGTNIAGQVPRVLDSAGNIIGAASILWPLVLVGAVVIYGQQAKRSAKTLFTSN